MISLFHFFSKFASRFQISFNLNIQIIMIFTALSNLNLFLNWNFKKNSKEESCECRRILRKASLMKSYEKAYIYQWTVVRLATIGVETVTFQCKVTKMARLNLPLALLLVIGTVHIAHAWQPVPSSSFPSIISQLNNSNLGAVLNNFSAVVQQIISAFQQSTTQGTDFIIWAVIQFSKKKKRICRIYTTHKYHCPMKVTSVKCYDCKFSKSSCSSTKVWKPNTKKSNLKARDVRCD